jgi:molybdate transport system ATP-binding protein
VDAALYGPSVARPRLDARFDVPPGVTLLLGPSGAGKTSCLLAIAGLVRPDRGRIVLGSEPFFDSRARLFVPAPRRRVGLVFQSLALFPHMTVAENVAYGVPRGLSRRERGERVARWLGRMRIDHHADRRPALLSGGEAQRAALARALASEPRLLLLDEPFSALDASLREELGREVSDLVDDLELPVLLVTHNHDDARRLGARAVVLREGRVVAQGPAEAVLAEAAGGRGTH